MGKKIKKHKKKPTVGSNLKIEAAPKETVYFKSDLFKTVLIVFILFLFQIGVYFYFKKFPF